MFLFHSRIYSYSTITRLNNETRALAFPTGAGNFQPNRRGPEEEINDNYL
jgi:hypothetical protein